MLYTWKIIPHTLILEKLYAKVNLNSTEKSDLIPVSMVGSSDIADRGTQLYLFATETAFPVEFIH